MSNRLSRWLGGAGALIVGGVWGLDLARFLALEARISFLLSWGGTLAVALSCGTIALLLWWTRVRAGTDPATAVLSLSPLGLPLIDLFGGSVTPWRAPVLLLGGLLIALVTLWNRRRPVPTRAGFVAVTVISILVYLPDVAPWVGRADTFEFQVVAPRLGIAHPSGYPLYILIGKLFSLLPFGTIAWRVNVSAAVCSALAAGFLYLALRARHAIPWGAMLASLTLAFSPTLWSRSIEAEVYALNALIVALALWIGIRWREGTLATGWAVPALGLIAGLGIASHLTLGALLLFLIPLVLGAREDTLSWRTMALAALLFLVGVSAYLYIPLRWPAVNDGETMTTSQFFAFVTNAESGGALRPLAFLRDPARWGVVFRLLRLQVGWAGLVLALGGWVLLLRRRWTLAVGSALAFGAWLWFNLGFYVAEPDYSAFLVPAHVVMAFWLGTGICELLSWLDRRPDLGVAFPLTVALIALLPMSRLWMTGPTLNTARERADEAWGRTVMELPIEENATILADSEKFPPLYYLQTVEGLRPDLDLVMRFEEAGYWEELQTRMAAGQAVYVARYLPDLAQYSLRSLGPLVEVGRQPLTVPPLADRSVGATFDGRVTLLSFDLEADDRRDRRWHLTLNWQAVDSIERDLEVRLRLVNECGEPVWETVAGRPVGGFYPTQAWTEGAVVPDYHSVSPPAWLPSGTYTLHVGLAPRFEEKGLDTTEGDAWVSLERIDVELPQDLDPLPNRRRVAFSSGAWLTGFEMAAEAAVDEPFTIDLAWRGIGASQGGQVRWVDPEGRVVETADVSLAAEAIRSRHTISTPSEAGRYTLRVGLVDEEARCGWLAPRRGNCPLAEVEVRSVPEGVANFGDRMLLVDAEVGVAEVRPNETVPVRLTWRALRSMEEDYTISVQLIGPDGRLYGQVDTWPVQGARPTSDWVPGEGVVDPYEVRLDPDAPEGEFAIRVNCYLLATMKRLPVIGDRGEVVGDSFAVGQVQVVR